MTPLRVRAIGGLCNRLRVTLSYRALARAQGQKLEVVWVPDGEIAKARFADVFEPLEDVTFLDAGRGDELATTDNTHAAPIDWGLAYRDLRLVERWDSHCRNIRRALLEVGVGFYQAMHMRRTDLDASSIMAEEADEDFLAWAEKQPGPIFLATDNGRTQKRIAAALSKPLVISSTILEHLHQDESGQRNTPLGIAAVDLFVCAGARRPDDGEAFKGCGGSSFTLTIMRLRKIGGWWS